MASYCHLPCIVKTGTIIWGEMRSKQLRRWKGQNLLTPPIACWQNIWEFTMWKRAFSSSLKYVLDCHTHAITLSNTDQQHLVQDPTGTFGIYWILKDCRRPACGARSNWQTTLVSHGSHNIRAIVYKWIRKRMFVQLYTSDYKKGFCSTPGGNYLAGQGSQAGSL